jgi:hypothetical protein
VKLGPELGQVRRSLATSVGLSVPVVLPRLLEDRVLVFTFPDVGVDPAAGVGGQLADLVPVW